MDPTVLITDASQEIGKATALLFAHKGYNVVLAARQNDRLQALPQELRSLHHAAIAIPADVRDPDQVNTLGIRVPSSTSAPLAVSFHFLICHLTQPVSWRSQG